MPFYGDSYGGVQAAIANDQARRQRGLEWAFANMMRGVEMQQRRKELADSIQRENERQALTDEYRNRVFNENVRQFNESIAFNRNLPAAITSADLKAALDLAARGKGADLKGFDPNQAALVKDAQQEYLQERAKQEQLASALTERDKAAARLKREQAVPRESALRRIMSFFFQPGVLDFTLPHPGGAPLRLPAEDIATLQARAQQTAGAVPPLDARTQSEMVQPRQFRLNPTVRGYSPMLPPAAFDPAATTNTVTATNAPMSSAQLQAVVDEALAAIELGADPLTVTNRFYKITGKPLVLPP